ncbi:metallophosphoesterase family protein [Wansuia hejianensis]|uniref:DNA repair exonuclease n=1 Tax=Wansuia hejianensis TaxID=2763667 RepID=A0A7G9GAI9_9FIRM|nr:DNA repair exonuclease [Wansuia hejianensis]QNM07821.1 DNA repair exonuclease [Wansuia hejianensis]RHV86631.1 DNA repair exonuclease [Lachnospiraceae bacterium OF09-33XD]
MKIIHTADIHLGASPDLGYPWSRKRKEDIWNTWKRLIERVRLEKADLLLVSGDLFHRQPLVRELKEVNYLFSTIPDTTVVLMAGNHDYIKKGSYYPEFPWNKNVIGLWNRECVRVSIPKKNVCVYGCSYYSREVTDDLYQNVRPSGREAFHILLAHGGDEKHSPVNRERLAEAGFQYAALGHIHKPQVLLKNRIAFSGALEPIDRNDTGPHGFMKVICTQEGTTAEFVPFASCSYLDLDFDVKEETTQFELEEWVHKAIRVAGEDNIYRVRLRGLRDVKTEFSARRLEQTGNVSEVVDETRPAYDFTELSQIYEGGLIGEYVDCFAGSEDPVEQKALFYGIEALLDAKREL